MVDEINPNFHRSNLNCQTDFVILLNPGSSGWKSDCWWFYLESSCWGCSCFDVVDRRYALQRVHSIIPRFIIPTCSTRTSVTTAWWWFVPVVRGIVHLWSRLTNTCWMTVYFPPHPTSVCEKAPTTTALTGKWTTHPVLDYLVDYFSFTIVDILTRNFESLRYFCSRP